MRAAIYTSYGPPDVVRLGEMPKPAPAANEVLIRIHATTVTSADWRVRSLSMPAGFGFAARMAFGFSGPRQPVLGSEMAGTVEAIGTEVTRFGVGDPVVAFSGAKMGCHAEYRCMAEDGALAPKPANLSYEEAASMSFGGTTALHFFRRAGLREGERVLVNGASGAVGTAAVQLARHFGAEVTGVCSASNGEMVRSLGADHVIDYTREDFARNGESYDVIMDTAGTAPFSRSRGSLRENGRLLLVLGGLADLFRGAWISATTSHRVISGPAPGSAEHLRFLAVLAGSGGFTPVIDRRYPLERIADAHRYVDTGRKRGNVVVTVHA